MDKKKQTGWIKTVLLVLVALAGIAAYVGWYKFFREEPQPPFATPEMRFKYGSLGAENEAGIPYWIFVVLPRMFPEYLPGPGGYVSLGMPWEPGQELPVGFTKKVVGFPRVANNCAVCHTASYRSKEGETPTYVVAGSGHTSNVQGFFRFLTNAGKDPRFNADNLLREIALVYDLPWLDRQLYRFVIIPIVKKRLIEQGDNFIWMNRPGLPDWARGRDDPMNLTKYFMLHMPEDGTFGPADMPSIWNLQKYKKGMALNWDGATTAARSVIIDSALGLVVRPQRGFMDQMDWLEAYLKALPSPRYPFAMDKQLAAAGEAVFEKNCAACHSSNRTGTSIPLDEIGTDRSRLDSWSKAAAIQANKTVKSLDVDREGMVEATLTGYIAVHLDGVWLRAPYLHNGSVPTLRDLLEPPAKRPKVFYRGYDVYDQANVGFITQGKEAERVGSRIDVSQRGNGNQGHVYGTGLPPAEKNALIEYLKTL